MKKWQHHLHEVIYEADTKAGRLFDIILLVMILISVLMVALESVYWFDVKYHDTINIAEWIITILFTLEYIVRVICVNKPLRYIFSFYGIIDFLSTVPKYISLLFVGTHSLIALRALRLLRIFRILKLTRYIGESNTLLRAIKASRPKILVFMFGVVIICIIFGTIMYLIEGNSDSGFTSIPRSIYWCIVTLTTVGYGDIAPQSPLGQFLAALIMIMGYGIIAVPTGIVSAEFTNQKIDTNTLMCQNCLNTDHKDNAQFCHQCGNSFKNVD